MPEEIKSLTSIQKIAEAGEKIYAEKYKEKFEREHPQQYAVIDILTGNAYVGEFAEDAMQKATKSAPNGVFHLIRIGSAGAFKVSRVANPHVSNWPF